MRRYVDNRPVTVFDSECYPNYWSIAFLEVGGKERFRRFERTPDQQLDVQGVRTILRNWRVISFNGVNYDMPMLALALSGANNKALKEANDLIIPGNGMQGLKPWVFEEHYGVYLPEYVDHIDLMEVSPGSPQKPSLKIYAGRLHSKRMQDLPFEPSRVLSVSDIGELRTYHRNDLEVTKDFYLELKPQIELRAQMSADYGVDLRSKSDAQVAEAVIRAEIKRRTGSSVYKPDATRSVFKYKAPPFIRFLKPEMQAILRNIERAPFVVESNGVVKAPEALEGVKAFIGDGIYRMGIGGLHSSEKSTALVSDDDYVLLDRDVTSYYPNIILGLRLFPKHLGPIFLEVYKDICERRVNAKELAGKLEELIAEGDKNISRLENEIGEARSESERSTLAEQRRQYIRAKNTAETLKIVLNGLFGKFGSPYAVVFSPHLLIQTTVTGQLAILMPIEMVEDAGMTVVSANTDGFVTRVPRARRDEFEALVRKWEEATGYKTEETAYKALYSRDVNNYIAITEKGKVKLKGTFASAGPGQPGAAGMKKNPDAEVVTDAVVAWLKDRTPIEHTIRVCTDIRRFVSIRKVKGGAVKDGVLLGKAIRWYMGVGEQGSIHYKLNGNTVPRTNGATPCMELPDEFPLDVDYDWYVREAYATLADLGIDVADPALHGRKGWFYGRLPDQKTWHVVDLPHGHARCGHKPVTMREPWVESRTAPTGERLCKKCGQSHAA